MSGLVIDGVSKRFGAFAAVDNVDISVPNGSFVCILGPSGCGKTTLLRMIAGLEQPSAGRILVDGEDITSRPAHERDFGMVFQSLALFPHLTVGENVAYPLRIRGVSRAEREKRAEELLALVRLPGLAARAISQLSGGQRQRVAIARALALSPKLFLLDEPLSALDAKLREAMQVELRQLQRSLGVTTLLVTHDQREAMTLSDLVLVMNAGKVMQAAHPVEIYRRPVDTFVADFIGTTNLLAARAVAGGVSVPGGTVAGITLPAGRSEATLSVRPEDVRVLPPGTGPIRGKVVFVRDLGATIETFVEAEGTQFIAVGSPHERPAHLEPGAEVSLDIVAERCVVLPA